jgi:ABC-type Mn2+/Zn2+ transport system permease subunit
MTWLRRWIAGDRSVVHAVLLGAACGSAFHLSPPLLTVLLM